MKEENIMELWDKRTKILKYFVLLYQSKITSDTRRENLKALLSPFSKLTQDFMLI